MDFDEVKRKILARIVENHKISKDQPWYSGTESATLGADFGVRHTKEICDSAISELYKEGKIKLTEGFHPAYVPSEEASPAAEPQIATMSYKEFKKSLLVSWANREDISEYIEAKIVADKAALKYKAGWLRKATTSLANAGFLNEAFTIGGGDEGGLSAMITGEGLEEAERLQEKDGVFDSLSMFDTVDDGEVVRTTDGDVVTVNGSPVVVTHAPASDRTVTLDHNSAPYKDAIDQLEKLHEAVRGSNEYRESDPEDHERRLADIEATLKVLENKRVNTSTVQAIACGTLGALAEKFVDQPIGELAKIAWDALKILLGI